MGVGSVKRDGDDSVSDSDIVRAISFFFEKRLLLTAPAPTLPSSSQDPICSPSLAFISGRDMVIVWGSFEAVRGRYHCQRRSSAETVEGDLRQRLRHLFCPKKSQER